MSLETIDYKTPYHKLESLKYCFQQHKMYSKQVVSSNNISSSSSIKSRFVLTHIDSEIVSFEQEDEIIDTEKTSEFKNLTLIYITTEVDELPSSLDGSSSQSTFNSR